MHNFISSHRPNVTSIHTVTLPLSLWKVVVDDPNDFFLADRNGDAIAPGEGTNIQSVESQSSTDSPFGGLPMVSVLHA